MADENNLMPDDALERLLNVSSHSPPPLGAEQRLMKRVAAEPKPASAAGTVPPGRIAWLSALPLAASLIVGIYLGQSGFEPQILGTQDTAQLMDDMADFPAGFEELELQADLDEAT